MSFGGLAPLPLRLGRGDDAGVSAEAHARLCADLVAVRRTLPVVSMQVAVDTVSSPATAVITSYTGRNGSGLKFAPAVVIAGGPLSFQVALESSVNALGEEVELLPYVASGAAVIARYVSNLGAWVGYSLTYTPAGTTLTFTTDTPVVTTFQIDIYGADSPPAIGDYGGDIDKHDAAGENGVTYAKQWYDYLKVAQGSAYSTSDASVRAWGLKAEARALGTSQRHTEMLAASASPGSADAKLAMWAAVLGVQRAGRSTASVRGECESRARVTEAPTTAYLTAAITDLLDRKATLTGIAHPVGTMSAWPDATYWPGVVNGPGTLDMGDGVWSSSRGRVTLQITPIGGASNAAITDIMSRGVAAFMQRVLPASDEWTWDIAGGSGFELDTSLMDLTAL